MNPLAVVARWLRWPCRLIERMAVGWADERAEAKLRHPSVRFVDTGDVTIDLADAARDGDKLRLGAAANLLGEEAEEFLAAEDALRMLRSSASPDAHRWARWIELDAQTDRRWGR